MRHRFQPALFAVVALVALIAVTTLPVMAQSAWTEPHPEIPYLPKPPSVAADYVVEHAPVTPNASPEARALLHLLYTISGKHTMTGQHNFAAEQEESTGFASRVLGKSPAVYGTDLGFAAAGDKDSAYVRHDTVRELVKQWRAGHVIALCWHAAPPTMDEPVTFRGQVQSRITDAQFAELLTPGTPTYRHWCAQVDTVAEYLKELQDAHVPVLLRPYHEINGDWFWWNGVRGDDSHGSKQLYRQIWERLVSYHHLTNLLFVWNCDRPERADRQFADYFPGLQYVDVLGLDCYASFKQSYYDDMNALSGGKVMAIAETSTPPTLDIYRTQPKWAYYMRWSIDKAVIERMESGQSAISAADSFAGRRPPRPGFPRAPASMSGEELRAIVADPRMLSLGDPEYVKAIDPVRSAASLPELK